MPLALVADDNPATRLFFREALVAAGWNVIEASDGRQAIDLADHEPFDLLLLDVNMPGCGAIEVLACIRRGNGPSRATPALATSAAPDRDLSARLQSAGFARLLPKPITARELRAAAARYVRDSQPATGDAAVEPGLLDDARAIGATGGDVDIVMALRRLLVTELAALPGEFHALELPRDRGAVASRLHRLDASAGFCGVPGLAAAIKHLRLALANPPSPGAIDFFLAECDAIRRTLQDADHAAGR